MANNLSDVSKSNQIMRQKCRKSVKCFANGSLLLTGLRMNRRQMYGLCLGLGTNPHTHTHTEVWGRLHLAAKIASKFAARVENVMQNVRKSAWQICVSTSSSSANCIPTVATSVYVPPLCIQIVPKLPLYL